VRISVIDEGTQQAVGTGGALVRIYHFAAETTKVSDSRHAQYAFISHHIHTQM
jgi:hypothetical protein